MQRLYKIDNLEAFRAIKLNARVIDLWRYSPILATLPPVYYTFTGRVGKGFLSFVEEESFLRFFPMDILKKGLNIVGPFQAVIDHKSVLKNIHDENGHSS